LAATQRRICVTIPHPCNSQSAHTRHCHVGPLTALLTPDSAEPWRDSSPPPSSLFIPAHQQPRRAGRCDGSLHCGCRGRKLHSTKSRSRAAHNGARDGSSKKESKRVPFANYAETTVLTQSSATANELRTVVTGVESVALVLGLSSATAKGAPPAILGKAG
jgi:hypothetical protein